MGESGKWWPYIELMPDVTFFCDLPQQETDAVDDQLVQRELIEYKKGLDAQYQ